MQELKVLTPDPSISNGPRFISPARLMSPDEVAKATQDRDTKAKDWLKGLWMLCGDIHKGMFDLLAGMAHLKVACRISAFTSPLQYKYGVFTNQAGPHQHRFIFPLWEPTAVQLLQEICRKNAGFLLSREYEESGLLLPCAVEPAFVSPLLQMCTTPEPGLVEHLLVEMPIAVSTLTQLDSIPSLYEGETVEEVSASLLMPTASLAMYERMHTHPASMKAH